MNNEIYKEMLEDYDCLLKIANNDDGPINYAHLQRLKKQLNEEYDKKWEEKYDFLEKSKDDYDCHKWYGDIYSSEQQKIYLIGYIIDRYNGKINDNEKKYVFLAEESAEKLERIYGIIIPTKEKKEIIDLYRNIEDSNDNIYIFKEEQEKFEKNNMIVYGKTDIYDWEDRYSNTRYIYFKTCLENSREEAINLMNSSMYSIDNRKIAFEIKESNKRKLERIRKLTNN